MRTRRLTYNGAYHHVMNHGIGELDIFSDNGLKNEFIGLLKENQKIYKVEIYAFCIMSNHYHIVMKNSNMMMSNYLRSVESTFALLYNKINKRHGYVFQNRFKSPIIENDDYLKKAVLYVFFNPVRSGIVEDPFEYEWSSIRELYVNNRNENSITNTRYVERLFADYNDFAKQLIGWSGKELPIRRYKEGEVLGSKEFLQEAIEKYNTREGKEDTNEFKRRIHDRKYQKKTKEEIYIEIENKYSIKIDKLKYITHKEKRIRHELILKLREEGGYKFKEIKKMKPFRNLKYSSMSRIYNYASKLREEGNLEK